MIAQNVPFDAERALLHRLRMIVNNNNQYSILQLLLPNQLDILKLKYISAMTLSNEHHSTLLGMKVAGWRLFHIRKLLCRPLSF